MKLMENLCKGLPTKNEKCKDDLKLLKYNDPKIE